MVVQVKGWYRTVLLIVCPGFMGMNIISLAPNLITCNTLCTSNVVIESGQRRDRRGQYSPCDKESISLG